MSDYPPTDSAGGAAYYRQGYEEGRADALRSTSVKRPTLYILDDGREGTEAEALRELVAFWERRKRVAEEKLEDCRRRLALADDQPAAGDQHVTTSSQSK